MPQPGAVGELSAQLERAYERAWERIVARQAQIAADPARWAERARLRALLAEVETQMRALDAAANAFFVERFPAAYEMGAAAAAEQLGADFRWVRADRQAVRAAAEASYDDLLQATRFVRRTTKQLIRALARDAALGALIEGRTATGGARLFRRELERGGIKAVRYKDGSLHGLAEYSQVVLRTTTANAYNAGTINFSRRMGTRFMEVFDGNCGWTSHNDVDLANGTIRSVEECARQTLSHPRCIRSFGPRPDIANAREAQRAPLSTTEAQRADQAAANASR